MPRWVADSSPDDIACHLVDRALLAVGASTQTDQRFSGRDAELHGHHPCRLVHDVSEVRTELQIGTERALRRVGLHGDDRAGGDVGQEQGVGVLIGGQRASPVPIEVERTHSRSTDPDGKAEHRSRPDSHRLGAERHPPGDGRVREVGLDDRTP